jgi:hypothetical protein
MYVVHERNVNRAYRTGAMLLRHHGVTRDSRAGRVLELDAPCSTVYERPTECVLFDEERDANPFFHLFEALWMLGGRNDVAFPAQFNARMLTYSDDGTTQHGAYGYRWRRHWDDQLATVIRLLRADPLTRRAVLQMWDPAADLTRNGVDVPCNTAAYFSTRNGVLDLLVSCRSNDMVWGAYGANVVHFSLLQQYVAAMVGVPVGTYTQVSFNFHAYVDVFQKHGLDQHLAVPDVMCPYEARMILTHALVTEPQSFDDELQQFLTSPGAPTAYRNTFLRDVAAPLYQTWRAYKAKTNPRLPLTTDLGVDWAYAAHLWLRRRGL